MLALALLGFASGPATVNPNTALTPAQHAINFPIDIDGGVHTVDCNFCHGPFESFSEFSCTNGCHAEPPTDAAHLGITPAYVYTPTSCYQCHPQGDVSQAGCRPGLGPDGGFQQGACFDHSPYFPIRPGQLHDGCSGDAVKQILTTDAGRNLDQDSQGLPYWDPNGGSGVTCPPFPNEGGVLCQDCHPAASDGGGHLQVSCLRCHPVPGMAAIHDAGAGFGIWTPDDNTCIGCHVKGEPWPPAIGLP